MPGDPLGEFVLTAKKREQQSGTRRPMGWKRKAKGHVPGAERERFERGCGIEGGSRSSLKGNSFQGRSGLWMILGSTATATGLRARSMWARRPLGGKVHRRRQDVSQDTMRRPRLSTWRLHLFLPPKRNEVRRLWPRTPPASVDAAPRLRTCVATDTHVVARDQQDVAVCGNYIAICAVNP